MKKIILLVDWKVRNDFWLVEMLKQRGYQVKIIGIPNYNMKNRTKKYRKIILWWQYLLLGLRGAKAAKDTDCVIIGWNFICGVFAAFFSRHQRNKVIALNLIAFKKNFINNVLRKYFYIKVFSQKNIIATVNSQYLLQKYSKEFNIPKDRFFVLKDPMPHDYETNNSLITTDDYVFSGGEAARDWDTLCLVASKLINLNFLIIAREKTWHPNVTVPDNVHVIFDTSSDEFYLSVRKARLVYMPLKGKITAGLIVLKRSILLDKLVITTDTPSIDDYYPEECRDLLLDENAVDLAVETIMKYWNNSELRDYKLNKLKKHIEDNYSIENYVDNLLKIIKVKDNL